MTVEDLLGDFGLIPPEGTKSLKEGRPVTIWLPTEAKTKYDRLQEKSKRLFGKKAREVLIKLIQLAEERIP